MNENKTKKTPSSRKITVKKPSREPDPKELEELFGKGVPVKKDNEDISRKYLYLLVILFVMLFVVIAVQYSMYRASQSFNTELKVKIIPSEIVVPTS